jgi:hypothetical protein
MISDFPISLLLYKTKIQQKYQLDKPDPFFT